MHFFVIIRSPKVFGQPLPSSIYQTLEAWRIDRANLNADVNQRWASKHLSYDSFRLVPWTLQCIVLLILLNVPIWLHFFCVTYPLPNPHPILDTSSPTYRTSNREGNFNAATNQRQIYQSNNFYTLPGAHYMNISYQCGKIIFYCTLFYVTNPQPYPPTSFPTSFALIIIPDNPPKSQTRCYMTTRVSILMAGSTTGCLTGTAFLMSLF